MKKFFSKLSKAQKGGLVALAIVIVAGVATLAGGDAGWLRPHDTGLEKTNNNSDVVEEDGTFEEEAVSAQTAEFARAQITAAITSGKPILTTENVNANPDSNLKVGFAGIEWYVVGATNAAGEAVEGSVAPANQANVLTLVATGTEDYSSIIESLDSKNISLVVPRNAAVVWALDFDERGVLRDDILPANQASAARFIWLSIADVVMTTSVDAKPTTVGPTFSPITVPASSGTVKFTVQTDTLALEIAKRTTTLGLVYGGATIGRNLEAAYIQNGSFVAYAFLSDNTTDGNGTPGFQQTADDAVDCAFTLPDTWNLDTDAIAAFTAERGDELNCDFISPPVYYAYGGR